MSKEISRELSTGVRQHKIVKLRVRVKVKSQKSKLDPEVGSVMGWPTTTHHITFFEMKTAN